MDSQASAPKWSKAVKSLRSELRLSQSEFGKRLGCSAMAVSRWERGQQPPSSDRYLEMAKVAGRSFGWLFWNLAGITEDDIQRMPDHGAKNNNWHDLSKTITVLETEVARSESRATRRDALLPNLPTQALRREYKAIATAEANFSRLVARHVQLLKRLAKPQFLA